MSVTIASLYWGDLKTTRAFREPGEKGFHTVYFLAGVPVLGDPPSTRVIHPAQSRDYAGDGRYFPRLVVAGESEVFESTESEGDVSARLIADDIINEFGQSIPGTPGKGVWICGGDKPTPEEIEENTERQILLARYVVADHTRQWISNRKPAGSFQRAAARWVGEQPEWLAAAAAAMLKPCPFCGKQTPASAPVCQECNRVHDKKLMQEREQGLGSVEETLADLEKKMPDLEKVKAIVTGEERGLAEDAEMLAENVTSAKQLQRDTISKAARDKYVKDKVHGKKEEPVGAK